MYEESIIDDEKFWKKNAERIEWFKKFTKVKMLKFRNP